jgi:hypothetical protein
MIHRSSVIVHQSLRAVAPLFSLLNAEKHRIRRTAGLATSETLRR